MQLKAITSHETRDGNGTGRGGAGLMDGVFVPTPPRMTGKTFSPHPRPLEPRKTSPHPRKTLLFVNKNIIEIITKFILSNQISFQKKLNNICKCLTRQSHTHTHTHTKKTHSITQQNKDREPHQVELNKLILICLFKQQGFRV